MIYVNNGGQINNASDFVKLNLLLTYFGYYFLLEFLRGRTIGKFITGTKVALTNGKMPSAFDILLRTVIRLIPIGDAVSFIFPNKGWHDTWSNTTLIASKITYVESEKMVIDYKSYFKSIRLPKVRVNKRVVTLSIIGIIAILIFTNPSPYSYKQYVALKHNLPERYFVYRVIVGRETNYFVFSIYRDNLHERSIGILGNFFDL